MKPSAFARFFATSALLAIPLTARADLTGPYSPDANTVYLWHFDEAAGATSAASAVAGQNSLIAVDGNPATANPLPLSTSILGAGGSLGFGNAASISAGDLGLGYDGNGNGSFNPDISAANLGADVISTSSFMALNGAFTLEALVSLTSLTSTANREIISMENSSGTSTDRPFQFVITTTGSLRFREFASNVTFELAIPTTGPDAFQADTWFHAAYSYDGLGNGTLYWTLLDAGRLEASVLTTSSTLPDMAVKSGPLVIGNENRNVFGEGLLGKIDEVRISNVARAANEFVLVPEPSSALLLGMGALALSRRRQTRRAIR